MLETLIVNLSSPAGFFFALVVSGLISATVRLSAGKRDSLLAIVDNAASSLGFYFILLLAATFFDLQSTCRVLLDNGLLQFEFLIVTFVALAHLADRFIKTLP